VNFRRRPLTDEFLLLIECARWSFAGGEQDPVRRLASAVEWDRLVAASRRHRVQGLVWHCLRNLEVPMPAETKELLAADAAAVAEINLRAAVQSRLLLDGFSSAGVALLFIKGLTLSKLAYGDPFVKMGWDIDVLVPNDAAAAAAEQLQRMGFRLVVPSTNTAAISKWHRRRKESVWRGPDDLHVELHTRLADSLDLIPSIGLESAQQAISIAPGLTLPTLAFDDLFAYLCVHGASSAWFRLKWIADLAALLHSSGPQRIEHLYARSQELGAGRAVDQALLLAARTFGILSGTDLISRLESRPVSRWLANAAWGRMMREDEPTEVPFGTLPIHYTQLFLDRGMQFKIKETVRQLGNWVRRSR